jgi:transposase
MPHLNEVDRAKIAAYLKSGRKISDLATEFGVGKSTVSRIKKKWEYERSIKRKAGSDRPKATNEDQDTQLINFLRQNPINTAANAINETRFPASRSTAARRIAGSELDNYYAARKPFLTNLHKEQRVGFALQYLHEEDFLNRVVFSGEKTFKSCYDGRIKVHIQSVFEVEAFLLTCDSMRCSKEF